MPGKKLTPTDPKVCPICGKTFNRKRQADRRITPLKAYARQVYCSQDCARHDPSIQKTAPDVWKTCQQCGQPFTRRRAPSGNLLSLVDFERRHFCSKDCAYAYAKVHGCRGGRNYE